MKKNSKSILRTAALCLVSLLASFPAIAANKVYVEDMNVTLGQEVTINVMMENEDNISSLQMDMKLPAGLTYVANSEARNTGRITSASHSLTATTIYKMVGDVQVFDYERFAIFAKGVSAEKTAINGNSGAVFSFKVMVSESFTGGKIELLNAAASNATKIPAEEVTMEIDGEKGNITPIAGSYSVAPEAISFSTAENDTVDFFFDNVVKVYGLQAQLTLPEGVEVAKMLPGDRLPDNVTLSCLNSGIVLVESPDNQPFEGEATTPLFSIVLKGTKAVENGTMSLSDVLASNQYGAFKVLGSGDVAVEVISINQKIYAELSDSIAKLQQSFNEALEVIRNYTSEEAKAFAESEEAEALTNELTEEKLYLDAAYQAGTLDETYEFYAKIEDYKSRIQALAEAAAETEAKSQVVLGDADGDGFVTIADANAIVNHFLGNQTENFNEVAADVDGDGVVTIADANAIVNIFLNNQ